MSIGAYTGMHRISVSKEQLHRFLKQELRLLTYFSHMQKAEKSDYLVEQV